MKKKTLFTVESISCENFFSFSFEGRMLSLWTKGQGGPVLATMPLVLSFVTFSNRNSFLCSSLLDKAPRLAIRRVIVILASYTSVFVNSSNMQCCLFTSSIMEYDTVEGFLELPMCVSSRLVLSCSKWKRPFSLCLSVKSSKLLILSLGGRLYLVLSCLILHQTKTAFPSPSLSLCLPVKSSNLQNLFCLDGGGLAGAF